MRSNVPAPNVSHQSEERQQQLEDFIGTALGNAAGGRLDDILIVARSPESTVARALFALSASLAVRSTGARIVFAASAAMAAGETWQLAFDPSFGHEIRLITNPRFLAAHEQLVIGETAVWFGDSMRREPDKRDAFASWSRSATESRRARQTFGRLWAGAEPLYTHHLDTVARAPMAPQPAPAGAHLLAAETLETLKTWQALNRH